MKAASKNCVPEVYTVTVASYHQWLSLKAVCSALDFLHFFLELRPMESSSGDKEENTEDIPGEFTCHTLGELCGRESKAQADINLSYS